MFDNKIIENCCRVMRVDKHHGGKNEKRPSGAVSQNAAAGGVRGHAGFHHPCTSEQQPDEMSKGEGVMRRLGGGGVSRRYKSIRCG